MKAKEKEIKRIAGLKILEHNQKVVKKKIKPKKRGCKTEVGTPRESDIKKITNLKLENLKEKLEVVKM